MFVCLCFIIYVYVHIYVFIISLCANTDIKTHTKIYIYIYIFYENIYAYCGAKEFNDPGPLYTRPKASAEEGKMPEDIQRKRKWPRDVAKDDPVFGTPDPRRKERHAIKGSFPERLQKKGRV